METRAIHKIFSQRLIYQPSHDHNKDTTSLYNILTQIS